MKTSLTVILAAAMTLGIPRLAAAEADSQLDDRFMLQLGGFLVSTDTTLRVDATDGRTGTKFDWESELGAQDADRFRADALWRITPRHHLRAMYFDVTRKSERSIDEDIEFNGELYPIGASVRAESSFTILQVAYEYAFLRRENYEVSASVGIHNVDVRFRLRAELTANGQNVGGQLDETASSSGPLPVLGLRGIWRVADKWYLDGHAQLFALKFDQYEGRLIDAQAAVIWQTFRHVGLGLGYNYFGTRVDVDSGRLHGRLEWDYSGLMVFARATF